MLSIVLFSIGSIVGLGNIVVGSSVYGPIVTTYLSYSSIVRNVTLTLFGAILMSSAVIIRPAQSKVMKTLTGLLFLGLLVVNLIRLVTLPPDWSSWDSGFQLNMLAQFEISTALSFILLLSGLILYSLPITLGMPSRGLGWYLSIIVAMVWTVILFILLRAILFPYTNDFGQGWSMAFVFAGGFSLIPMSFTLILILSNSFHEMRYAGSYEKEE